MSDAPNISRGLAARVARRSSLHYAGGAGVLFAAAMLCVQISNWVWYASPEAARNLLICGMMDVACCSYFLIRTLREVHLADDNKDLPWITKTKSPGLGEKKP